MENNTEDKKRFANAISVRLDKRIYDWIHKEAQRTGASIAETIRRLTFLGMEVQKLENNNRQEIYREIAKNDIETDYIRASGSGQQERIENKKEKSPSYK